VKNSDLVQRVLEINTGKKNLYWSEVCPEFSLLWLSFIGRVSWPQGYWVHHLSTAYLDIQVVDEGKLVLTRDGRQTVISAPALVVIPPGEHKLAADLSCICRKRYLGVQGTVMVNNMAALNLDKVQIIRDFRNDEFDRLFNELHQMADEKNPENVHLYSSRIYQLLLLLSHQTETAPIPAELTWAVGFIKKNFANINSLHDVCLFCNCPKSTLIWQFKRHLNTTPMQYLTEVRMNHAAKQLRNTLMPIKEIAEKCGYSDQLYFSSAFKKHFHCSPRTYRKAAGVPESEKIE
jgi:AraC-like DNA-binding protein